MRWLALSSAIAAVIVLFLLVRGASASPNVRIVSLSCDTNPETVVIRNFGDQSQSMAGWQLQSDPSPQYFSLASVGIPAADGVLDPGESVTIYSGAAAPADSPSQGKYRWTTAYRFRNDDPTDYAALWNGTSEIQRVHCGETPPTPTRTPTSTPTRTPTPTPQPDADGDGIPDALDNCPLVENPDQTNTDGDAMGNACDPDDDNDTVPDGADNCPLVANATQANTDGDALGNACDTDDDNDGLSDSSDNCPLIVNADQANNDGDALGDACDSDDDNDAVDDLVDNCPLTANPGQANHDNDPDGDSCDTDDDNDGYSDNHETYVGADSLDACPDNPTDDAWPPDVQAAEGCGFHDARVTILDILCYKPKLTPKPYDARYDLDTNGVVNILDVLLYKPVYGDHCTNPSQSLSVHIIDVGQGDAILIESGETDILIDGGPTSTSVLAYLQAEAVADIDLLVATHPHADHIGGLADVLAQYDVSEIWVSGNTSTSQTYQSFAAAVDAEGALVREVARGDTAQMNELHIAVLNPASELTGDLNEDSVVFRLTCAQVSVLLTGDATDNSEASMLAAGLALDADVLKVGHHGSSTSTGAPFLAAVTPDDAVISVGAGNPYGHPTQVTLDRLTAGGATIYRTDLDGTVLLTSDCNTYSITVGG